MESSNYPKQGTYVPQRTIYLVPKIKTNPVQPQPKRLLAPRPTMMMPRPVAPIAMTRPRDCLQAPQDRAVVRNAPQKRPSANAIEDILNDNLGPCLPRKRERLTHLTAEEKMDRRKLKNRVAAQTARDRKKERTYKLEDAVERLFKENERLRSENAELRVRLDRLEEKSQAEDRQAVVCQAKTFGSAASINAPQPRDQVKPSTLPLIYLMTLLSLMPKSSKPSCAISKRSTSTRFARTSSRTMSLTPTQRRVRVGLTIRLVRAPRIWSRVS